MLFGTNQRKPMGLFGGFAPSGMQQAPQADPMAAMGQSMGQAPMMQQGQQFAQSQAPKKPGIDWWGVMTDVLAGAAGREGPYAASMRAKQEQEAAQEHARQQREASMQDWRTKFDYENANSPKKPHYWESNDGSLMALGPDGQPAVVYKDPTPRMQFLPDGMGGGRFVPIGGEQGGDDEWGPVVNQRPGGASGNAGGGFPVAKGPVSFDQFKSAIIQQESGGRYGVPNAQGSGAMGVGQVMPATTAALAKRLGLPYRPDLMAGTSPEARQYQNAITDAALKEAWGAGNGNLDTAAMYYHGGSNRKIWGPKTQKYARDVRGRIK